MIRYDKITDRLIKQETSIEEDDYLLTAYFPIEKRPRSETKKHLKSFIREGLRDHTTLRDEKEWQHEIIDFVEKEVDETETLGKGLAIFMKIETGRKKPKMREINTTFIVLPLQPQKEITIDQVYDLDQFVWLGTRAVEGLVLNIHRKDYKLYNLQFGEMHELTGEENEFISEKQPEYIERFALGGGGLKSSMDKTFHGTGYDNVQRREQKENAIFLRDILDTIEKYREAGTNVLYVVVATTNKFAGLIEEFIEKLETMFPSASVLTIDKSITQKDRLEEEAVDLIEKHQKKRMKDIFNEAQDSADFILGWNAVSAAAREGKIEVLFVTPTANRKGYLDEDRRPYLSRRENARQVENIAPWIVKGVLQHGGKVHIIEQDIMETDEPISAQIRFE